MVKLESESALFVVQHSSMQLWFIAVSCVDHDRVMFLLDHDVVLGKILRRPSTDAHFDAVLLHCDCGWSLRVGMKCNDRIMQAQNKVRSQKKETADHAFGWVFHVLCVVELRIGD